MNEHQEKGKYDFLRKEDDLTIAAIMSFTDSYPTELVAHAELVFQERSSDINRSAEDRNRLKEYPAILERLKKIMQIEAPKEKAVRFLKRNKIDKQVAEELVDRYYNRSIKGQKTDFRKPITVVTIIFVILTVLKVLGFFLGRH